MRGWRQNECNFIRKHELVGHDLLFYEKWWKLVIDTNIIAKVNTWVFDEQSSYFPILDGGRSADNYKSFTAFNDNMNWDSTPPNVLNQAVRDANTGPTCNVLQPQPMFSQDRENRVVTYNYGASSTCNGKMYSSSVPPQYERLHSYFRGEETSFYVHGSSSSQSNDSSFPQGNQTHTLPHIDSILRPRNNSFYTSWNDGCE